MMIFALVMLLIDIENFKLGKYIIGGVTLAVAVMSILVSTLTVFSYLHTCLIDSTISDNNLIPRFPVNLSLLLL